MRAVRRLLSGFFAIVAFGALAAPPPDLSGNWNVSIDGLPVTEWHVVVRSSGETLTLSDNRGHSPFWWVLTRSDDGVLDGHDAGAHESKFRITGKFSANGTAMTIDSDRGRWSLSKAATIVFRGKIVSSKEEEPIRGATLTPFHLFSSYSPDEAARSGAVTDSRGRFTLRRDAPSIQFLSKCSSPRPVTRRPSCI